MKTARTPALVLALLYFCFLGYHAFSSGQLPDQVATHFDSSGQPNGWMSRSTHLLFTMALCFGVPLFVVATLFVVRCLSDSIINIPHRDYWLAAERRAETCAWLFRHSLWFACIGVSFITGVQYLIVRAVGRAVASGDGGLLPRGPGHLGDLHDSTFRRAAWQS